MRAREIRYRVSYIDPFRAAFLSLLVSLCMYAVGVALVWFLWRGLLGTDRPWASVIVGAVCVALSSTVGGLVATAVYDVIAARFGGLPISLVVDAEEASKYATCPSCGAEVLAGRSFCPACDRDLGTPPDEPPPDTTE